ncbi:MAG: hypothetical protein AAF708_05980 [Deinococcota bacterium]
MLELVAIDTMNLDGKGSTSLFTGSGVLMRPSDTQGIPFDHLIPTSTIFS